MSGGEQMLGLEDCHSRRMGKAVETHSVSTLPRGPVVRPYPGDLPMPKGKSYRRERVYGRPQPAAAASGDVGRLQVGPEARSAGCTPQESADPRFRPCRDGVFEKNLVVLGPEVTTVVNVGPGTAPETFQFRGNAWFQAGSDRAPTLPSEEQEGVHGVDPVLEDPGGPGMRITSKDRRLRGVGADAYEPPAKK